MHESTETIDSPDRLLALRPRALIFGHSPENSNHSQNHLLESPKVNASPTKRQVATSSSPPYRKVRALRLFDTPSTPNTIIQESSFGKSKAAQNHNKPINVFNKGLDNDLHYRPMNPIHNKTLENVYTTANVNPFTPDSLQKQNKKRPRTVALQENVCSSSKDITRRSIPSFPNWPNRDDDDAEQHQAPKRLALQDTNISRYRREFVEISLIGTGEFGRVYQCLNRLDGCTYAVKKSIKPVAGSVFEKTALNEVWAHAVLGKHDNVVRYYSAWAENNHMLIQNEYCNGGSLQTVLETRYLSEWELRILLTHIAGGLKYIHSHDLCHMDIKSGNIFLSVLPKKFEEFHDRGEIDEFGNDGNDFLVIYKIGDLGHVTSVSDPQVEEGDCRYLPNEVLQEDFSQLFKADMFALGMTLYEAGGGGPLPKNGDEWHKLRMGDVPALRRLTKDFNNLIKLLMHPEPLKRPSSTEIFNNRILCPSEISKAQLTQELIMERNRNALLHKQLREMKMLLKSFEGANTPKNRRGGRVSPLATDRKLRSYSKKSLRSGKTLGSSRDQNKNIYGTLGCLR